MTWRSERPPVPPRRVSGVPALEAALLEAFRQVSASDVSDAVGPLYTMDPGVRPLHGRCGRMVGVAATVKAVPGDNRAILGGLSLVTVGEVLVVDWRGYTGACGSGSKALAAPSQQGLAGVVIDGAWRDVAEIEQMGVPLFGRAESLVSPAKNHLGEIGVPVHCGGVVVSAGDLIVGDASGVVVVPHSRIAAVAEVVTRAAAASSADTPEALRRRSEARRDAYLEGLEQAGAEQHPWSDPFST